MFTTPSSCRVVITHQGTGGRWVLMGLFGTPGKTQTITLCAKSVWWSGHAASGAVSHLEAHSSWQHWGYKNIYRNRNNTVIPVRWRWRPVIHEAVHANFKQLQTWMTYLIFSTTLTNFLLHVFWKTNTFYCRFIFVAIVTVYFLLLFCTFSLTYNNWCTVRNLWSPWSPAKP